MAFDLNTLNNWVNERADLESIFSKPFLADPTLDYVEKLKNVKSPTEKVTIFEPNGKTSSSYCSTTETANSTIKQAVITSFFNNYYEEWCLDELKNYFTTQWVVGDSLEVMDKFMEYIGMAVVQKAKEYLWLNNTAIAGLPADFKRYDGLLKQIDTNTTAANVFTFGSGEVLGIDDNSGSTVSIITAIRKLYEKMPAKAAINQDLVAFVPPEAMQWLKIKIQKDNLFHYKPEELELNKYAMRFPGISNLIVVAAAGLGNDTVTGQDNTQKDRIVMTPAKNIMHSLDIDGIKNTFEVGYDKRIDKIFIRSKYWLGGGVKFFDFVTTCKRA